VQRNETLWSACGSLSVTESTLPEQLATLTTSLGSQNCVENSKSGTVSSFGEP
jgi:hypothetical protein